MMEQIYATPDTPQEPLATRTGEATASRRRRQRMWLGLVTGTAMMVAVGMTTPQPAAAACWYDPRCLVDAVLDPIFDTVKGVLKLTWNVITLDPEDAWEDLKEVGYNQICGAGLSVFTMAVANGLEEDFDECASPPHSIELDVLEKLQLYIKSPLDTVHIHEGCNLNADVIPGDDSSHRNAITFGEHIYFEPGEYHPQDDHGFALLAHELTHVLQYRQKGFADFTCQYATHCAFGLYQGCEIEESAYDYQDLVLQDRQADSDGVFPPTDNCPDDPNPYQADANGDGIGDACDPNQNLVDRSGEYGTPPVASPPTAVVLPGLGVSNIAYRDTSGQLHELWRDAQGTTGTTNLTANAGAPPAVGTPFAYVDTSHNTEILLYRDDAGTVRSLYWSTGAVGHDNLGDTAGAPKAAGDPVGYYVAAYDTHNVIYRTSDGHLHSLYWVGVAPVIYGGNLTGTIEAPPAAGDPTAFVNAAGVNIVVYRSMQGDILSVYWADGPSGLDNLSGVAGTPPAAGDPAAYYTAHNDTHQVVYLGEDGHLYELYWAGVEPVVGWDLTAAAGAPAAVGTPAAYYSASTNTKHVIYRDADGGLHEIWWVPGGGTPAHVDLSAAYAYGAPPAAGDPVAFTVEGPNTQHVVYRGTDQHIYEMRW